MNLPNICTLSRVPMMFIIVAMLYVEWSGAATVAFLVFVLAGITDFLDGYLARKLNQVSNFGVLMDAVTDKVLLLGIMIALVDLDMIHAPNPLPTFMVLLILGREFLITGLRLVAASKGVVVSADRGGKQKTVTQILAVSAILLAHMFSSDVTLWISRDLTSVSHALSLLGLALFVLATVFTVSSGARYFRKYASMVFTD
jgi:CDP-diacylglycerol--glycerol-3-phosphate 3-phosphatidyltransferase